MNGTGYDAETKLSVSHFDKDQRTRLEAVTAARALAPSTHTIWLDVAAYIERGRVK